MGGLRNRKRLDIIALVVGRSWPKNSEFVSSKNENFTYEFSMIAFFDDGVIETNRAEPSDNPSAALANRSEIF